MWIHQHEVDLFVTASLAASSGLSTKFLKSTAKMQQTKHIEFSRLFNAVDGFSLEVEDLGSRPRPRRFRRLCSQRLRPVQLPVQAVPEASDTSSEPQKIRNIF